MDNFFKIASKVPIAWIHKKAHRLTIFTGSVRLALV